MKKRPSHILRGNKGNQRPQHVILFDTETRPITLSSTEDKHVLRLGWACYYRPGESGHTRAAQWYKFDTPYQFWAIVEAHCKDKKRLYLVAHNVAFDLRIVKGFSYLKQNHWKEAFSYDKGLTTILRFTRNKQSLEILSTTNFFGFKLADLGSMVGIKKGEVDFATASEETLSAYCRRDVEIILKAWKLWIGFLDNHDLGSFRRTISSQAFASYRHRFMNTPILIHSDMAVCRLERESYRGGRTECFKVGVFPIEQYYYVDVNGMYAHQMASHSYPVCLQGFKKSLPLGSLSNKLRNFAVIARVALDTEIPAFVTKHDERNVYPVGAFEAVLTTPHLKYGLEMDVIKDVKDVSWYKQGPIFKGYVSYFTGLKEQYESEGNMAFRDIAKLYINALYGKFGQTGDKTKEDNNSNAHRGTKKGLVSKLLDVVGKGKPQNVDIMLGTVNHQTGRWVRPPGFTSPRIRRDIPQESYNSFPAIVAHVTAYARQYLWELILLAGQENTFYCDTDSLIVNQKGLDNLQGLLHPTKPGFLKVEKQGTNLAIYAPKDYVISDRVRQKGIRRDAVEVGEAQYRQDQFLGLAGARRRGDTDLVTIKQVVKTLKRRIKTGVVGESGWVIPFRFPLQDKP